RYQEGLSVQAGFGDRSWIQATAIGRCVAFNNAICSGEAFGAKADPNPSSGIQMMPEASGASCGASACRCSRKKTSATVSPSAGVRPATYTKDFTRTLAVAEITAPAYACEARTTGPRVRSSTRSNAFTSSLRDVKGIGAATTLNLLACKGRMTLLQLEPSAHAPCTMTMLIVSSLPFIFRPGIRVRFV